MNNELLKDKLIEYLEINDLKFIDRGDKISHCCLNPEHQETNPSSFTLLNETPFSYCSSCGFYLTTENLYELLDLGLDSNVLFISQINSLLNKKDKKSIHKEVPIFLPIEEGKFEKDYRGISKETFEKVGAYYTIPNTYYARRIIFPIYDVENTLKGFEAISTNKKITPKVLRPKGILTDEIFGFEHLIDSDTVFITEGLFSALSFIECGYSGVYNFGVGSIKNKIKKLLMKGIKNVIICGDNDEVGKKFNKESYQLLKHNFNVCYFNYPYKSPDKYDTNDLLKDIGSEKFKIFVDKMLVKNMIKIERG